MFNVLPIRQRYRLAKGSLLAALVIALFMIINHNARDSTNTDTAVKDVAKRRFGNPGNGLNTRPPKRWSYKYTQNPCYEMNNELFCGPAVYLMGIQNAGLDSLRQAIGLHPDVDCYKTGFFSSFSNMKDIKQSDIHSYVGNFENSTEKIQNGARKLCICDYGSDLARPYDLELNNGIISPPKFTTAAALATMYRYMKVIVILRDPTVRFIQEYCALGIATPFDEVVDDAIAGFLDCENNATRDNASCVYDASLSGLLQAGLYDFLIEQDLSRIFGIYFFRLLTRDDLVNNATRRATMESVFYYLDKDVPAPSDPYWAALDELFAPKTGDCNGQTIADAAKQKLRDFYSTRATIYAEIA